MEQPGVSTIDNAAFHEARDSFLETVPEGERSQFESCSDLSTLLEQLRSQLRGFQNKGNGLARSTDQFLDKVHKFGCKVEPYFDVIGILISSNPQYSAIFWGALRLVLKVFF
jgi:hypothetical protein